jgi:hypothetical protein
VENSGAGDPRKHCHRARAAPGGDAHHPAQRERQSREQRYLIEELKRIKSLLDDPEKKPR